MQPKKAKALEFKILKVELNRVMENLKLYPKKGKGQKFLLQF
jgi:hypothetical protein